MTDFTEQIKNGIKFLDEVRPGWAHEINLDKLDVQMTCDCVLGQTMGYWKTVDHAVPRGTFIDRDEWAVDHGFKVDDNKCITGYDDLTEQWKTMIEKCRARESADAVL